ncbi:hypothetical protein QUF51_12185 [Bacillus pumilus]|nr:hypothetical protein [Bacillus pumilus]OLP65395.1 hypothetical protein BACPU_14830 [Bacillus pumilus]
MKRKKKRASSQEKQSVLYYLTDAIIAIIDMMVLAVRTLYFVLRKAISSLF